MNKKINISNCVHNNNKHTYTHTKAKHLTADIREWKSKEMLKTMQNIRIRANLNEN